MPPKSPHKQRPSVGDVATLAGVSLGTVSNVLNHPDKVAASTRDRVERAMTMLGYVPNTVARSLQSGTTQSVGLIVSDLSNSLFVDIARGAESGVEQGGLTLMIANSDARVERESAYLRMFAQARVTGVLMTLNDAAHFAAVARAAPPGVPLVLLNFGAPVSQFCSVDVDNALGGYVATRHLIESGCRRLVFVGGPHELQPVVDRGKGFQRAIAEQPGVSGEVVTPDWINRADGWTTGVELATRVARGEIDGIFAASDLLAAGIVQALSAASIRIPDDVAIVGYDNNQAAWDSPVPITTVAQPGEEVGRLGAMLLQDEARGDGPEHTHSAILLPPQLVVRGTTRPTTAGR
ncbi:LacI family DNA-binding transcriptional regulator [Cellulomonas soli]|uniref:Transcriptional regulator n=1 Tax=Cellulomonas soli TaxID=931535 RepID=A0A512PD57_9CELL|nr:LacI family DNA-binding transcriptional regulator [Cellulomonas soli]NYI60216.1 LacI family transcriptional regulator [Cellulomonas soli]GEP69130.1 transcriptional regulator [Cellulomonas soli]